MNLDRLFRSTLPALVAIALLSCSEAVDKLNIEIEPTLGMMGGAILATQDMGIVAQNQVAPGFFKIENLLRPVPKAWALAGTCGNITTGDCLAADGVAAGANLQIFYNNCISDGTSNTSYWRSYVVLEFPSQAACTAVKTNGFNGAGLAAVTGQTIKRTFGSLQDDQENIRLAPVWGEIYEGVHLYSKFDSGWNVTKKGGLEITFTNATDRKIVIKGLQAISLKYDSIPINPNAAFDLMTLSEAVNASWNHTVNTVKTGDTLYEIGPTLTQAMDGTVSFGTQTSNPAATFDGDIIVLGNTVQKGATFRIQQNILGGVAVATVMEDLVYDDPLCCWPTSGVIESRFDMNYPAPTTQDRIQFFTSSCGAIEYTNSLGKSARSKLTHCF